MYKKDFKQLTMRSQLLLLLLDGAKLYTNLASMGSMHRAVFPEYHEYKQRQRYARTIYRLRKSGQIQYEYKYSKKLIKLTTKGELEALMTKVKTTGKVQKWDNKWRLVLFDIPEQTRDIRDRLRTLLKKFGFKPLQASVYVSPYPLNVQGIDYLNKSKLITYIRMLRVDKVDNDIDLKKAFKIK